MRRGGERGVWLDSWKGFEGLHQACYQRVRFIACEWLIVLISTFSVLMKMFCYILCCTACYFFVISFRVIVIVVVIIYFIKVHHYHRRHYHRRHNHYNHHHHHHHLRRYFQLHRLAGVQAARSTKLSLLEAFSHLPFVRICHQHARVSVSDFHDVRTHPPLARLFHSLS